MKKNDDSARILFQLFRRQENNCELLVDTFVNNGKVRSISAEDGELTITVGIKMKICYKKLFKVMIDKEVNQKELAEKAGISVATITKMKKGEGAINTDVWDKICRALDCSVGDILEIVSA